MEIVVIGMGYAGIPAAAMLAGVEGFNVTGVQRRSKRSGWKIDYLNAGKNPIGGKEPGLAELIEKVVKKGSFKATDDISICKKADVIPGDDFVLGTTSVLRTVTLNEFLPPLAPTAQAKHTPSIANLQSIINSVVRSTKTVRFVKYSSGTVEILQVV